VSTGVSSYSYDGNGNLTASSTGGSFSYNAKNQTTAVTWGGQTLSGMAYAATDQSERTAAGSTTYDSSPLGLQISRTSSQSTYFLRDGKGNLIGERTPDGSHWYYLKDGLGSIVAVINGAGGTIGHRYSYDPYGKVTTSTGSTANPFGFQGGLLDPTGLVKFGARYYDPNLGRFTQVEATPFVIDSYPFAADCPVNYRDPSGQAPTTARGDCGTAILYGDPNTGAYHLILNTDVFHGAITGGFVAITTNGFGAAEDSSLIIGNGTGRFDTTGEVFFPGLFATTVIATGVVFTDGGICWFGLSNP